MTFEQVLDQAEAMLQKRGRVSYKALVRQFDLDEEYLKDLKYELVNIMKVAQDEDGELLVYIGEIKTTNNPVSQNSLATNNHVDHLQHDIAERRQLSVMFIDLIGSTELSQLIDPEDLREILYQYQDLCDKLVSQHTGVVMQHSGDGIVAYFGYPIAHEDDPHRAVMAGLAILKSLDDLNKNLAFDKDKPLQVRIGVHTGLVVVGATGGKGHSEITAIGEVPNLAARIQGVAEPNHMVISETTNTLINESFETLKLGFYDLKGFTEPLELYQVEGRKESKIFNITSFENPIELYGRDGERERILARWALARESKGQTVLVNGEAGIGKSHLVEYLAREIALMSTPLLTFQCSPFHRNTAFKTIIDSFRHEMKYEGKDTPKSNLDKLEEYLKTRNLTATDDLALFASLLSIAVEGQLAELNISPERRKKLISACILRWLRGSKIASLVLIEDLQWADPSTLELLEKFIAQISEAPVLFLGTFRPEFQSHWDVGSNLIQIDLSRINREAAKSIINQVAQNLPTEVVTDLLSKTDGNPLFIEELTKLVLESGVVKEKKGVYTLKGSLNELSVPKTLQDSLMARLDQLGPAKKVAQIGATIGRNFSYSLIKAIGKIDEKKLKEYLNKLANNEMLFVKGEIPNAVFTFKHALIQEAAYSSLLKKQNQEFHRRIVKNLEKSFPDIVRASPELLAHHCNAGGIFEEAIYYWKRAGDLAISRSAHAEAINHLNKGLVALKKLPESQQHISDEILFQIALGVPLTALRGYGSIEVEQAYERAKYLCQQAGDTWQLIPALYGLWRYYLLHANYKEARELSDQILSLAQHSDDPVHLVVANRASGSTSFYLGELQNAGDHLEEIFKSDASPEGRAGILLYDVVDAWITARSYASLNYWLMGYPDRALEQSQMAISMAERLRHPFSIALSYSFASWLHQFRSEFDRTLESSQKGLMIAEENGFAFWIGWGKILEGWAKTEKDTDYKMSLMREGLKIWHDTQSKLGSSYFLFLLAENWLNNGDLKEAWNCLQQARDFVESTGEKWWEAELYRLEGELHLASEHPDHEKAEQCYRSALKIAAGQKARSLELRAATSLAKLLAASPKKKEGIDILKELVDWFKEGLELPDMLEAKTTLDNLSAAKAL